jgi:hypothetical protein
VVNTEVPNAPAVMRTKFDMPDALGNSSGVRPLNTMACSGMKKNAIAAPCSSVGIRITQTVALVLKFERIHSTNAKPTKATVASLRGSRRDTFLPTQGDMTMASSPTGASTRPDQVAV